MSRTPDRPIWRRLESTNNGAEWDTDWLYMNAVHWEVTTDGDKMTLRYFASETMPMPDAREKREANT